MKKIVFLVSGGGGNLKFFHQIQALLTTPIYSLHVISDRPCDAANFAKSKNIPTCTLEYNRQNNLALFLLLQKINPDIIVTNWHKIIDAEIVSEYQGKLINLHYSLLPAYAGLIGVAPIAAGLKNGSKILGATCHYVNENVDAGEIIYQAATRPKSSLNETMEDIFRLGCLILFSAIMKKLDHVKYFKESPSQSSYFFSPADICFPDGIDEDFRKELAKL